MTIWTFATATIFVALGLLLLNRRQTQAARFWSDEFDNAAKEIHELRTENSELIQRLDAYGSRLDREMPKLARAVDEIRAEAESNHTDLLELARTSESNSQRISELAALVKDGTLDTAVAALEERVAKIESAPVPGTPQGRRGGSAWPSHQIAASAGAARANGADVPLPTPGVS